jgi:hypothetical protein
MAFVSAKHKRRGSNFKWLMKNVFSRGKFTLEDYCVDAYIIKLNLLSNVLFALSVIILSVSESKNFAVF